MQHLPGQPSDRAHPEHLNPPPKRDEPDQPIHRSTRKILQCTTNTFNQQGYRLGNAVTRRVGLLFSCTIYISTAVFMISW